METNYKFDIIALRFLLVKPSKKRPGFDMINSEYSGFM